MSAQEKNKALGEDKRLLEAKRLWSRRAKYYNHLRWAKDKGYLEAFINAGDFKASDSVLDVGTGTGIVAHAVSVLAREVIGIDISMAMLKSRTKELGTKAEFRYGNVAGLKFPDERFDKITARMVFHHLDGLTQKAISECHRLLKPQGLMVLSEGVPPERGLKDWYSRMFALKENRLTFFKDDLVSLMNDGGFKVIRAMEHVSPQMSIKNWLRNSAISLEKQQEIINMHLELDPRGRSFYNMKVHRKDILVDFKYVILVGKKE